MDGKVKLGERQKNMGVRLCRRNVESPKVSLKLDGESIVLKIESEEGLSIYHNGVLQPQRPNKDFNESQAFVSSAKLFRGEGKTGSPLDESRIIKSHFDIRLRKFKRV